MKTKESAFLGTGWSFPPTFSRVNNSVEMVSDERDINESLRILFSTALGARIMLPTYGADLWSQVFKSVTTAFKSILVDYVYTAIINWEMRIDVVNVTVTEDDKVDGLLMILVNYTIRQTNSRGNLVYPFYIGEGTLPQEPT